MSISEPSNPMPGSPDLSPEFFRLAVEAAPNAMIMINDKGAINLVNGTAERMFGYRRDEMLGKQIELLLPVNLRTAHILSRDAYLKDPTTRAMGAGRELMGLRKDGTEVAVEIGLNPIHTPQGVMVLAAVVDITERRRAEAERHDLEERVRHSQKLESLGVLAGGIAHDFNNLLSAILGNAELAQMHVKGDSPAARNLDRIVATARRAAELSRQMLAYSGRGKFEVRQVDLSKAVAEIAELLNVSVTKKAHVTYEFADNLPLVEVDVAQLNQIVMNLITNASDALGADEGEIVVRTGLVHADRDLLRSCIADDSVRPGSYVFFEVRDTGAGMDEATIKRIFDPFFTTKFTGRGLGLSAVLGIVRGHKGAILVESEPGKGTTMRVMFRAASRAAVEPAPVPHNGTWRGTGLVLLADDEELVRGVARAQLENLGFEVMEAIDGEDALNMFRKYGSRLVLAILDLTMPRMDGDKSAMQMLAERPDLPVILASGYSAQDLSERLRDTGVVLLSKPFSLADLQACVRRAIGALG